ncbi:hypothetical protein H0H92_001780 [Tricholoma furcatifolium]|nr:hypothetical protein H0H92_001780 [Tricholoma furcatifolium]
MFPEKLDFFAGRPINSLALVSLDRFTKDVGMAIIQHLELFSETLHTLSWTHSSLGYDWSAATMISAIAKAAPELKSLMLSSFSGVTSNERHLVSAIAELQSIETLVICTDMKELYDTASDTIDISELTFLEAADPEAWKRHHLNPKQCRKVASEIMKACPRLRQLSFPVRSSKKCMTYLRSTTTREGELALFDGWRMIEAGGW